MIWRKARFHGMRFTSTRQKRIESTQYIPRKVSNDAAARDNVSRMGRVSLGAHNGAPLCRWCTVVGVDSPVWWERIPGSPPGSLMTYAGSLVYVRARTHTQMRRRSPSWRTIQRTSYANCTRVRVHSLTRARARTHLPHETQKRDANWPHQSEQTMPDAADGSTNVWLAKSPYGT